jgi:hypothetical protein
MHSTGGDFVLGGERDAAVVKWISITKYCGKEEIRVLWLDGTKGLASKFRRAAVRLATPCPGLDASMGAMKLFLLAEAS